MGWRDTIGSYCCGPGACKSDTASEMKNIHGCSDVEKDKRIECDRNIFSSLRPNQVGRRTADDNYIQEQVAPLCKCEVA
jgi:hypothetical protein